MKYVLSAVAFVLIGMLVLNAIRRAGRSEVGELTQPEKAGRFLGIPRAHTINLSELSGQLNDLVNGKTEFGFIGIHSKGTDCIYFMYENDMFNIDYEAMAQDQVPYIELLKQYADSQQIKTTMTTYGNAPHYKSDSSAPVLQLKTNVDLKRIVEIARDIQNDVFNNSDDTVYEVVP